MAREKAAAFSAAPFHAPLRRHAVKVAPELEQGGERSPLDQRWRYHVHAPGRGSEGPLPKRRSGCGKIQIRTPPAVELRRVQGREGVNGQGEIGSDALHRGASFASKVGLRLKRLALVP